MLPKAGATWSSAAALVHCYERCKGGPVDGCVVHLKSGLHCHLIPEDACDAVVPGTERHDLVVEVPQHTCKVTKVVVHHLIVFFVLGSIHVECHQWRRRGSYCRSDCCRWLHRWLHRAGDSVRNGVRPPLHLGSVPEVGYQNGCRRQSTLQDAQSDLANPFQPCNEPRAIRFQQAGHLLVHSYLDGKLKLPRRQSVDGEAYASVADPGAQQCRLRVCQRCRNDLWGCCCPLCYRLWYRCCPLWCSSCPWSRSHGRTCNWVEEARSEVRWVECEPPRFGRTQGVLKWVEGLYRL